VDDRLAGDVWAGAAKGGWPWCYTAARSACSPRPGSSMTGQAGRRARSCSGTPAAVADAADGERKRAQRGVRWWRRANAMPGPPFYRAEREGVSGGGALVARSMATDRVLAIAGSMDQGCIASSGERGWSRCCAGGTGDAGESLVTR
jgi:hypothetical protein